MESWGSARRLHIYQWVVLKKRETDRVCCLDLFVVSWSDNHLNRGNLNRIGHQ